MGGAAPPHPGWVGGGGRGGMWLAGLRAAGRCEQDLQGLQAQGCRVCSVCRVQGLQGVRNRRRGGACGGGGGGAGAALESPERRSAGLGLGFRA